MYQPPKVIALDADCSMLHPEPTPHLLPGLVQMYLHPHTLALLAALRARGSMLVLATGRKKRFSLPIARLISARWTLCEHGGLIFSGNGRIDQTWFQQLAPWVGTYRQRRRYRGRLWDYWRELQGEGFVPHELGTTSFTIDLNGDQPNPEAVRRLLREQPPTGLTARHSRFNHLDVFPAIVNKGTAFIHLLARLEIPLEDSAAVGDDPADLELLSAVGLPCTIARAQPACTAFVQKRHGYIAPRGGHAGIQQVLAFLLTGERQS